MRRISRLDTLIADGTLEMIPVQLSQRRSSLVRNELVKDGTNGILAPAPIINASFIWL